MASLYKRTNADGSLASQFWWCKWTDPATGARVQESTKCRIGNGDELRKALKFKTERELRELTAAPRTVTRFDSWVPDFLRQHYLNPRTRERMEGTWITLQIYLNQIGVHGPEQLRREQCLNYVTWREELGHGRAKGKPINRNTVVLELKLLTLLMDEAMQRRWVEYNCASRLKVQRARPVERGEILPEHEAVIREAIRARVRRAQESGNQQEQSNADFLRVSFEIAMLSGMRQAETYFHLRRQVNFTRQEIKLRAKGKDYTAPLNPALAKFLRELVAEGREWTYERPRMMSLVWFKFMDKLRRRHPELRGVHFHGARASVISRLEEAGAPEKVVMKLVNHASTTVHRTYRRVHERELSAYWSALTPPPVASPENPHRRRDTSAAKPPRRAGSGRRSRTHGNRG